jgi:hypothetical protein
LKVTFTTVSFRVELGVLSNAVRRPDAGLRITLGRLFPLNGDRHADLRTVGLLMTALCRLEFVFSQFQAQVLARQRTVYRKQFLTIGPAKNAGYVYGYGWAYLVQETVPYTLQPRKGLFYQLQGLKVTVAVFSFV